MISYGLLGTDLTGHCVDDSGTEEYISEKRMFPNPSGGSFTIKIPEIEVVGIVNSTGKFVAFNSRQVRGGLEVHIMDPASGIYFIKAIYSGTPYSFKVIVIP